MLYKDLKPGDLLIADLGYGGVAWNTVVTAKHVYEGRTVFGSPEIVVQTECGLSLAFSPEQSFNAEECHA